MITLILSQGLYWAFGLAIVYSIGSSKPASRYGLVVAQPIERDVTPSVPEQCLRLL